MTVHKLRKGFTTVRTGLKSMHAHPTALAYQAPGHEAIRKVDTNKVKTGTEQNMRVPPRNLDLTTVNLHPLKIRF